MTINLGLGHAVTFMKFFASVVYLIFLPKILIWNKITFPASHSLNVPELVVNELTINIFKKFYPVSFYIQFFTVYCEDFRNI